MPNLPTIRSTRKAGIEFISPLMSSAMKPLTAAGSTLGNPLQTLGAPPIVMAMAAAIRTMFDGKGKEKPNKKLNKAGDDLSKSAGDLNNAAKFLRGGAPIEDILKDIRDSVFKLEEIIVGKREDSSAKFKSIEEKREAERAARMAATATAPTARLKVAAKGDDQDNKPDFLHGLLGGSMLFGRLGLGSKLMSILRIFSVGAGAGLLGIFTRFLGPMLLITGIHSFVTGFLEDYEENGIMRGIKTGFDNLLHTFGDIPLNFMKNVIAWTAGALDFKDFEDQLNSRDFDIGKAVDLLGKAFNEVVLGIGKGNDPEIIAAAEDRADERSLEERDTMRQDRELRESRIRRRMKEEGATQEEIDKVLGNKRKESMYFWQLNDLDKRRQQLDEGMTPPLRGLTPWERDRIDEEQGGLVGGRKNAAIRLTIMKWENKDPEGIKRLEAEIKEYDKEIKELSEQIVLQRKIGVESGYEIEARGPVFTGGVSGGWGDLKPMDQRPANAMEKLWETSADYWGFPNLEFDPETLLPNFGSTMTTPEPRAAGLREGGKEGRRKRREKSRKIQEILKSDIPQEEKDKKIQEIMGSEITKKEREENIQAILISDNIERLDSILKFQVARLDSDIEAIQVQQPLSTSKTITEGALQNSERTAATGNGGTTIYAPSSVDNSSVVGGTTGLAAPVAAITRGDSALEGAALKP